MDLASAAGRANVDSYMMVASQNVRHTLETALATYMENGGGQDGLEILTGSYDGLYYPYVLDFDANVVAPGIRSSGIGPLDLNAVQPTVTFEEVSAFLSDDGDYVWTEHNAIHPLTGEIDRKRSILVLHDDCIFGSGYYLKDSPDDVQMIKIGALVTPIDRLGGAGVMRMLATSIAEDDFNAYLEGKGSAWRIDVDIRHTHPGTDEPLETVKSFKNDGISFVTGPSASSSILAIKPYVEENDMTILSCCSTSQTLAIKDDSIFRLAPDDTLQGSVVAKLLINDWRSLLIPIWRNDVWDSGLADSVVQRFEDRGGIADTSVGTYKSCSDDGCHDVAFSEMVSALSLTVQQHIDQGTYSADEIGVVFIGYTETADFLELASGHDILDDVRWFGSDSIAQSADIVSAETLEFVDTVRFGAAIFATDASSDWHLHLTDRLAEHTELEPNVYVYSSYDTVWIIGLAIEAAGSPDDPLLVRAQMPEVARMCDSAIGTIFFNDAEDSANAVYNVWTVTDGKWVHTETYSEAANSADPLQ